MLGFLFSSSRAARRHAELVGLIERLLIKQELTMSALDDLKDAVAQAKSVEASAVTLIQGIATQLQQALANSQNPDPALTDLTTQLRSQTDALAAAITQNTPHDSGVGDTGTNNLGPTQGQATGYDSGSGVGGTGTSAVNPPVDTSQPAVGISGSGAGQTDPNAANALSGATGGSGNPANNANIPSDTSTAPDDSSGVAPGTDASDIEPDTRAAGTQKVEKD